MVTCPLPSPPAPEEAEAEEAPPTTAVAAPAPPAQTGDSGKIPAGPEGSSKGGQCWERLLAGAGDDLLTCVFEFLQVAELATAARLSRACRNVTRGEELWRQVALRMWGRLMGQRPQPLLPDGDAASSLAYDPATVWLGVPEMSFRDAVRSMVVTWPTQLDVSLMASEGLHKITVLSFGSAQPSNSSTSGSSSSSSSCSNSKDDASAGAAAIEAAAGTGGSWAARALEVVYAGYRLGSDRAVRADRPFPIRFPTLARHEGDGLSDLDEDDEEDGGGWGRWCSGWGGGGGEEEEEKVSMAQVQDAFAEAERLARMLPEGQGGEDEEPLQISPPSGAVKGKEKEESKRPRFTPSSAAPAQEQQEEDTKLPAPTSPMVQSPAPPVVPTQQPPQRPPQPPRPPPAPPVKPFTVLGSGGGGGGDGSKAKAKPPGIAFHPSTIAYFEVTIGAPQPPAPDPNAPRYVPLAGARAQASCVAIGVGLVDFPLIGKQPGWDSRSYGYHGDDGQKYHSGGHGSGYGPTFGEGDTVGCGLVYFTPNELDRLTKLIKPKPTPSTTTSASSSTKAASAASASSARPSAGTAAYAASSSSSAAVAASASAGAGAAANAPQQQQEQGVGQPYGTAAWGPAGAGGGTAAGEGGTGGLAAAAMAAVAAAEAAGASDSDDSDNDSDEEAEDDVELFDPLTLFMRAVAAATQSTGRVFFTKNGQFLGFAFDNVALSQPLYPVIGLDSYHTVRVNFGGPSNAPGGRPQPFVFDVWGFQRELLGPEVADALLLGACRRSSYNVHPLHKDMHAGLAQCREAVGMMGVPMPSEMFAHPGDDEEDEEEGDWWDMGDEDTDTNDDDYEDDGGEEDDDFDDDFDDEEEEDGEGEQDLDSLAGEAMEMGNGGGVMMGEQLGEEEAPPLVGFQLAAVPYNQQQQQQQQQEEEEEAAQQGEGQEEGDHGGGGSN